MSKYDSGIQVDFNRHMDMDGSGSYAGRRAQFNLASCSPNGMSLSYILRRPGGWVAWEMMYSWQIDLKVPNVILSVP